MEHRVTLKDMARRLGVSLSTVAKALHDDRSISVAQRKRVKQLAESLDYHPDPRLTALAAYRAKSGLRPALAPVAFVALSPFGPDWISAFYYGMERQSKLLGYQLSYYYLSPDISLQRHSEILHARGVCGIMLAPLPRPLTTLDLDWSKFSVVVLGQRFARPAFNRVTSDITGTLMLALENVQSLGLKRIGIAITHEQDISSVWGWSSAMIVAKRATQNKKARIVYYMGPEEEPASFLSWLKREKPEALISPTHPVQDWIKATGARVPKNLKLVTLDYHSNMPLACPGMDQNFEEMGAAGMMLLHSSLLQGETGIPRSRQTVLVQPRWVDQPPVSS